MRENENKQPGTAGECGWHITDCKAIKTLYKQTGQGFDLGLGKHCNRIGLELVRHHYSSVGSALGAGAKGNRGEHWDSERGNGSRRGAAESRQRTLLSPQSLPKLQEMDVKTTAAGERYP